MSRVHLHTVNDHLLCWFQEGTFWVEPLDGALVPAELYAWLNDIDVIEETLNYLPVLAECSPMVAELMAVYAEAGYSIDDWLADDTWRILPMETNLHPNSGPGMMLE